MFRWCLRGPANIRGGIAERLRELHGEHKGQLFSAEAQAEWLELVDEYQANQANYVKWENNAREETLARLYECEWWTRTRSSA